jgi:hypothetical protein
MIVRRMSALPLQFFAETRLVGRQKCCKHGPQQDVRFSPKAEVTGSNPVGRASVLAVRSGHMGYGLFRRHG